MSQRIEPWGPIDWSEGELISALLRFACAKPDIPMGHVSGTCRTWPRASSRTSLFAHALTTLLLSHMRCPQRMRLARERYALRRSVVLVSDRTRPLHVCEFGMQVPAFLVATCAHATRCLRASPACWTLTSFSYSLADCAFISLQKNVEAGRGVCFACAARAARRWQTQRSGAGVMRRFRSELCLGFGSVGGGTWPWRRWWGAGGAQTRRVELFVVPLRAGIYTKLSAACSSHLLRSHNTLATQAHRLLPSSHTSSYPRTQHLPRMAPRGTRRSQRKRTAADAHLSEDEEPQTPTREIATHPVPRTARVDQVICMRCAQYIGNVPHSANWQPCDVRNIGTVLQRKCWRCAHLRHDCDEVPDELVPAVNRVFRAVAAIEGRVGDEDVATTDAQDEEARVARAEFKSQAGAFANNKNRMSGGTPTKRRKTAAAAPALSGRFAPHELEEIRLMRRGIGALVEIGRSYMVKQNMSVANVDRLMRGETPEDDVPDE